MQEMVCNLPSDISKKTKVKRGEGTDLAYSKLQRLIVCMDLAPGSKIDEASLAKELGVSRTPLREALVRLAQNRLVTLSPNHGAQVTPLDALGLTQYFEALELAHRTLQHWACHRRTTANLETIRLACEVYEKAAKGDDPIVLSEANLAFHSAIADAASNEFVAEHLMKLSVLGMRIGWIWYREFNEERQRMDVLRTVTEHKLILSAIENRQLDESDRLAVEHIKAFRDRVFDKLGRSIEPKISISPP